MPPEHQSTAIAIVLSGGIAGAVIGPEYSKRTRSAVPSHDFVGCFLATTGVCCLHLVLVLIIRFPPGGASVNELHRPSAIAAPQLHRLSTRHFQWTE